jgi:serine/threonine protein kinase
LDVIIKEYCPEEYLSEIEAGVEGKMTRRTSANEFVFSSDDDKIEFQKKLDNFNEHKIAVEIKSRSMLERVIDCFTENNTVYIVMEDKGADTLEERINNGRISPNECIEFILNLLNAVKQLHADGYCHGDLKPTNILLHSETTVDGTYDKIALIDFGAVRKFNDTLLEYTKHYSPTWDELEKMTGDKHDYYSIGVILYETICGISHTRIPLSNYSRKDIRDDINKSIHRKGFSSRNNEYVNWIAEAIYRLVAIPSRVTNLDEIRDLLIDNKSEIDKDIVKRRVIKKRHFFM